MCGLLLLGEELPCQRVHTNSKDQFVVEVTKGKTKLIGLILYRVTRYNRYFMFARRSFLQLGV